MMQQHPQQSIVHMNQTLEESKMMREKPEYMEPTEVSLSNGEKGLSPEVRGKCFPPGRTTNVFNM